MGLVRAGLHLGALASFAIAWRFLEPLGKSPELLVKHQVEGLTLVALALLLVLLPSLVLLGAEAVLGAIHGPLRDVAHAVFVALLFALIAWQFSFDVDPGLGAAVAYPLALLAGAAAGFAYWRSSPVRMVLTVLSVGPVVVLALFLLLSPARALVLPHDGPPPVKGATAETPVVMVVLDEFPVASLMNADGEIDADRYPHFAGLAAEATWYRNAAAVADHTQFAVPAILTGDRPKPGEPPLASAYPDNLFRLLGGRYRLNVMEWFTDLCTTAVCPEQVAPAFLQRLRSLLGDSEVAKIPLVPTALMVKASDRIRPEQAALTAAATQSGFDENTRVDLNIEPSAQAEVFRKSLGRGSAPSLDFGHMTLPHVGWARLPTGQSYPNDVFNINPARWPADPRVAKVAYQRHLLQVGYTDWVLGRILDRLRQTERFDRSLIVVTADHGISFTPGEEARDVDSRNAADIASVPLIVKAPGQDRGEVSDSFVTSLDILPTIAEHLGVEVPWRMEGRPAGRVGQSRGALTVMRELKGDDLTIEHRALEAKRRAAVDLKTELFGAGDSPALFALAGHERLIGREVDALDPAPRGQLRAEVAHLSRYRSVDSRARTIPAEVTGYVRGGAPGARRTVALALNGTIVATAVTFPSEKGEYLATIAPPEEFRDGNNQVQLFAVSEEGELTEL